MAWRDGESFVDTVRQNPKRALVILLAVALLVIVGVFAKALAEWALTLVESGVSAGDVPVREKGLNEFLEGG